MTRSQPPVLVYSGQMFVADCPNEAALRERIDAAIDELGPEDAFGPLACGADILIAEAILARGARLHVVLPFRESDFLDQSVRCGGEAWVARYSACRAKCASIHFATPGQYVNDDHQFAYGSRLAMGLAALKARERGVEAIQLAVVSQAARSFSKTGLAGTAADVQVWTGMGHRTVSVEGGELTRTLLFPPPPPKLYDARRAIRSILFADYKGYSRLGERDLPLFMRVVMGRIGEVLDDFGDHVEFRNSWGDAIYAIIDDPPVAAQVALALRDSLAELPPALAPAGETAGMRLGLHFGPIYVGTDRVTRTRLWYGGEVNRTARIEPITPVGDVYCTEAFAAALLVEGCDDCTFSSIGPQRLAKGFGEVELYRLAGIARADPSS
jgi:adenylate cyclase